MTFTGDKHLQIIHNHVTKNWQCIYETKHFASVSYLC